MAGNNAVIRYGKHTIKTVTFTGVDGAGGTGTPVTVATTSGIILLERWSFHCTTNVGPPGVPQFTLGTKNVVGNIIPITNGSSIDATDYWRDATPEEQVSPATVNQMIGSNILLRVTVGAATSGVIEFVFDWVPMSTTAWLR